MTEQTLTLDTNRTVRVFDYVAALDAFVVSVEFAALSDELGLTEWHHAVWLGRLFALDNDFGEHWLDNWEQREALEDQATALGYDASALLLIVPERFADGRDGPCHTPEFRKAFWTDVLRSLSLSYGLLFEEARRVNAWAAENAPDEHLDDLEARIQRLAQAG